MSGGLRIDRRRFLIGALGAGSAVAFVGLRPWRALVEVTRSPLQGRLVSLLEHRESAAAVGRDYLAAQTSQAADAGSLTRAVVAALPGGREAAERASNSQLRDLLLRAIHEDFARRRVVRLRGWVVANTEARLCALVTADRDEPVA